MTSETTVGELARIDSGYAFKSSEWLTSGIPVVKIRNIKDGIVTLDDCAFVSESSAQRAADFRAESGGILVSLTGYVGQVGRVRLNETVYVNQRVGFVRPKNPIDSDYIYYLLRYLRVQIEELGTGTAQANVAPKDIMKLSIPSLSTESRLVVGNFLRKLDEKIEVNNAISKTLEDMAQTIFKSWFVDFDPVKAKMAGEKPEGIDDATAALFPDSMEESELGLIPQGWSWITVGDIAAVIDCLHAKKPELLNEGYPYLQLDTISDSGVLHFENAGLISKEDYDKWTSRIEVQGGDCLITNVGRVGAVSQVPEHFKAAIGRNITAMRPKDSLLHGSFLIASLLSDFMKKEIKRNTDSGTILEALNVKNIPKLVIPGPSDAVLLEFARLCDPLQLQIQELHAMNVNLKKIRDSLLPRLISGELQIPEEILAS
jgi:type I restriction enzyme S subunit